VAFISGASATTAVADAAATVAAGAGVDGVAGAPRSEPGCGAEGNETGGTGEGCAGGSGESDSTTGWLGDSESPRLRRFGTSAPSPDAPDAPRLRGPAGASESGWSAVADSPRGPEESASPEDSDRLPERGPRVALVAAPEEELDDVVSERPEEPDEPVVSAAANGTATTAEPIPNATASAPTRPT
jgi:hypothetical protein